MKVDGKAMRSIWVEPDGWSIGVIDQTALPHKLETARLATLEEAAHAIRVMLIRGAPLIGATAANERLPHSRRQDCGMAAALASWRRAAGIDSRRESAREIS